MSDSNSGDKYYLSGDFPGATIYIKSRVEGAPDIPIPLQRPPRAAHFTDRERELAKLLTALQPGRVVTLYGPGGIGKTALAAEAVWALAPGDQPPGCFPDGVVFHSFYNQHKAIHALESIALAFGVEPKPTPRDAAQRALANRCALLILDGTENADDLQAVLDVRGGSGVLVTSRTRRDVLAVGHDLRPLSHDDAVALLRAWGDEQVADARSASEICRLVGYLPLAVRLAGRYMSESCETAAEYLQWLEETPLQALDHGQRQTDSVSVLLEKSLAQVSDLARQVLAVVGLLALAPFGREFIESALGLPSNQLHKPLGELVSYGLLLRGRQWYEVSHALVHTFARERGLAPDGTLERLADYLIALAQQHQAQGWHHDHEMDAARPHIMAISTQLVEQGIWEPVVELTHLVTRSRGEGYLQVRGFWNDEEEYLNRAIATCRILMKEDGVRGESYWAHHEADFEFGLGDLLFYKDQYEQAIETLEDSLGLCEQANDLQEEAIATHLKLGEIYLNRSNFDSALEHFQTSLHMCEQMGKSEEVLAPIHLWIGRTYRRRRAHSEAMRHYQMSLTSYNNAGDKAESAFVLIRMSVVAFDLGEEEQAWEYLRESEDLIKRAERNTRSAEVRRELGNQYRWKRKFKKAEELQLRSLQDFEELGDRHNIAWSVQGLGDTYFEMGDDQRAEEQCHQALKLFGELGIRHGQGYAYDHLGMIRLRQERADKAREFFKEGLKAFRESGLQDGIAYLLFNLADSEIALGELEKAAKHYRESLRIWEELENQERIALTSNRLEELSRDIRSCDM